MGTNIRPEVSDKNPYWIERHRYYELKHFCLQYPIWKKVYLSLDGANKSSTSFIEVSKSDSNGDPVAKIAEARIFYADRIEMVERAARETDPQIGSYILKAVTEGLSYDILKVREAIPCGKDAYYELYRRFFWLLHKARR